CPFRCTPSVIASSHSLSTCSSLPSTSLLSPLSLHDALPISRFLPSRFFFEPYGKAVGRSGRGRPTAGAGHRARTPAANSWAKERSEEHTSELQSRFDLVCRLLLDKTIKTNLILQLMITFLIL